MSKKKNSCCVYCDSEFTPEQIENKENEIVSRGTLKFHTSCYEKYQASDDKPEIKVRQRTCPHCKEKLSPLDEDAVDVGNSTYHRSCYDAIKRMEKNRNDLIDYVSLKYNMEFPTGFMLKQISEYNSKRGYSYKAMKATLVYIIEIEKIPVKEGTGLGLIPHYYDKAKKYYSKIKTARKASASVIIDNTAVKITAISRNNQKKNKKFNLNDM